MTLIKEIALPKINKTQKIAFGILCTLEVNQEENFVLWANDWLSEKDRSHKTAEAMHAAAVAMYIATTDATMYAAEAAVHTTKAAMHAAAAIDLIFIAEKAMKY